METLDAVAKLLEALLTKSLFDQAIDEALGRAGLEPEKTNET